MIKGFLTVLLLTFFMLSHASSALAALKFHGFIEGSGSIRPGDELTENHGYNLYEGRFQLKTTYYPSLLEDYSSEVVFKGEIVGDGYDGEVRAELREMYIALSPLDSLDVRVGRQVLTWGLGDLLFINDLFPKDHVSFFIGRDQEYLKLPSDALRMSFFFDKLSADVVVLPLFTPSITPSGERISVYDPFYGSIRGEAIEWHFDEPENGELAARLYGNFSGTELAAYFFNGFYKEPKGIKDPSVPLFDYPRLNVYGASLRTTVIGGIISLEGGYYFSVDDSAGTDNYIENSMVKALIAYERDLGGDLGVSVQYYIESMMDFDEYKAALEPGSKVRDENRGIVTVRITKLALSQTLRLSLFAFLSPTDNDSYLRPTASYDLNDKVKITFGANIFSGKDDHTDFGQLRGNDNLYLRVRYSF
ncbi:MAG: hypothetical protein KAR06_02285 [Deltaproteobacteria bacterium]|nr:hypothetical protein [Deltaproteobacteria bacterium]